MDEQTYFALEAHIVERLSTIEGLLVLTTVDVSDATLKTINRPTAVVAYVRDEVTSDGGTEIQVEQTWNVFLICRGPTKERGRADGQLLLRIVQALHGWSPDDAFDEMTYLGTDTDYVDNARQYLAAFTVRTKLVIA